MAEKALDALEAAEVAVDSSCWKRFVKSRQDHKKRYFFGTCLIKLAAFISFLVVSGLKFDKFLNRPEYIAVCQYVLSEDLDILVDDTLCVIAVDQEIFTCDTEYGDPPTGTYYYSKGGYSYNTTYKLDTGYNSSYTTNSTLIAYSKSNSENDGNILPSDDDLIASRSSISLKIITNDTYPSSSEASDAQDFANKVDKGYLIFLYIVWVFFNFGFRVHSNYYTYQTKIIKAIPKYTKWKKLRISIYENLIEICVATAIYPFTYPDYGDCFECSASFLCDGTIYGLVNIGFYIVIISLFLTMFKTTRDWYFMFLLSIYRYARGTSGKKASGCQRFLRYLLLFLIICINLFAVAACIVGSIDIISTIYSSSQLLISIIFYFAFLCDGDVTDIPLVDALA